MYLTSINTTNLKPFILSLFLWMGLSHSEGFVAGTLVATQYGLIPVENIVIGDSIAHEHFVARLIKTPVICYAKIFIDDFCLDAALDQKFYVLNKGWVDAQELLPLNRLLCFDGTTAKVDVVEIVEEQQQLYSFCVETNHIFYVTHRGIIAHNIEVVSGTVLACLSVLCPPAAVGFTIVEAVTAGIVCFGAYSAYKKHQKKKKQKKDITEKISVVSVSGGSGKDPKDEEDDSEKHPHGIYEDAPYHTKNGNGIKGPRPKNGKTALDNSIPIEGSRQRIGIEKDKFVIFKQTALGKYHGYLVTWKDIIAGGNAQTEAIRKTLIHSGWVTKTGKIIKLQ